MNKALVELVRKYTNKAEKVKAKSQAVAGFYRDAAHAVLTLAKQ
jgi:hypothetical protein